LSKWVVDTDPRRCILEMMDKADKHSQGTPVGSASVDSAAVVSESVENRLADVLEADGTAVPTRSSFEALTEELASASGGYAPARALQALEAGEPEVALGICDSIAFQADGESLSVSSLSLPLIRGRALLAVRRTDEAAEEFHRVLREDPECPAALKGLGDTHFAQNKEVIAFTYYERARELSGDYQALVERVHFVHTDTDRTEPGTGDTMGASSADAGVDASVDEGAPALEEILEEIVVRDSGEKRSDTPSVSLTLKRGVEEPTPVETAPVIAEEPKQEAPIECNPTEKTTTQTAPIELTERYDRPQRPVHYQTETMADLLLQQGYTDAAIDIFRVLILKNPLARLKEKLAKAESRQKRR
jgi:tetratricopeptide (TPR) repeat protein